MYDMDEAHFEYQSKVIFGKRGPKTVSQYESTEENQRPLNGFDSPIPLVIERIAEEIAKNLYNLEKNKKLPYMEQKRFYGAG